MESGQKGMSFVSRCKSFFELKPGQTLKDFAEELRALSDDDVRGLVRLFNEAGMPTALPEKLREADGEREGEAA